MNRPLSRKTACLLLALCTLPAVAGLLTTALNWDLLAYVGIVQEWRGATLADAHRLAYADVEQAAQLLHMPRKWAALVDPAWPYRAATARDPAAFVAQLPFYRIRPIYLGLLLLLGGVLGSTTLAALSVTFMASVGAAAGVARFCVARAGARAGSLVTALFCLSPPVLAAARFCTADALATAVSAAGTMLLLADRALAGALVLALAVGVRSDMVVANAVLAAVLAADALRRGPTGRTLAPPAILLASVIAGRVMEAALGAYTYAVLFHVTFTDGFVPNPAALADHPITARQVLAAWTAGVHDSLGRGGLPAIGLGVVAILPLAWRGRLARLPALLVATVALTAAARFALFPSPDLRLLAPLMGMLAPAVAAAWGAAHPRPGMLSDGAPPGL